MSATQPKLNSESALAPRPRLNPSYWKRTWDLSNTLAAFVADGLTTVSADDYEVRLRTCDRCSSRFADVCLECGCFFALKARISVAECPLKKWPNEK